MTTDPTSATRNRTGPGMLRGTRLRPEVTGDSRLARARERFLAAEPIEPGQVRETILASWRRSREWHVAADRIDLTYVGDPGLDTPLTRNALPVLQNLHENLEGQPISVILTDAHGVALSRLTADHDLERLGGIGLSHRRHGEGTGCQQREKPHRFPNCSSTRSG